MLIPRGFIMSTDQILSSALKWSLAALLGVIGFAAAPEVAAGVIILVFLYKLF